MTFRLGGERSILLSYKDIFYIIAQSEIKFNVLQKFIFNKKSLDNLLRYQYNLKYRYFKDDEKKKT